jgi:purine-nucleoside phosphorylase
MVEAVLLRDRSDVVRGGNLTTDAPYRETERTIAARKSQGLLAVEMEAAALYAFAEARAKRVVCFAHVTNRWLSFTEILRKARPMEQSMLWR